MREGPRFLEHDLSWWSGAACRGAGLDLFFDDADVAPVVCATCPVRQPCGAHGLLYEYDGTWGGMTQKQLAAKRLELSLRLPRL